MPARKRRRTDAEIAGERLARHVAVLLGEEVRRSRRRRGLTQQALAERVGLSRQRIGDIEAGRSLALPMPVWFGIAAALNRYLKFEFGRDALADVADAGHLAIQELVIRVAKAAGWEVQLEAKSRAWESNRSIDVRLIDRKQRRIVIVECWNTFGDVGAAARSSNAKVRDEEQHAVAIAGDGPPFAVHFVWVVRDTRANRELIARYPQAFAARLPGSSHAWLKALTMRAPPPTGSGLVWCDVNSTRLLARRARPMRWQGRNACPVGERAY
jgi:transcriptional regulator with XRE-family HTH domain